MNGDCYIIKPVGNSVVLAVADGLGHGDEAAAAGRAAMSCVEAYAQQHPIALFQLCHSALKRTRGVVMNLALFSADEATLTWLGVGNVEGILLRADATANPPRESILLRGGVIGLSLPQLYAAVMPIHPGDTLVFATDGIAKNFSDVLNMLDSPQRLADRIGAGFSKGNDDALVVVGRYSGR